MAGRLFFVKKVLFSDINREIKKEKRKVTRNNRNIQSISHFPFFFLPDHRMKNKLFGFSTLVTE